MKTWVLRVLVLDLLEEAEEAEARAAERLALVSTLSAVVVAKVRSPSLVMSCRACRKELEPYSPATVDHVRSTWVSPTVERLAGTLARRMAMCL